MASNLAEFAATASQTNPGELWSCQDDSGWPEPFCNKMLSWPAFRRSGPETSRLKRIAFWVGNQRSIKDKHHKHLQKTWALKFGVQITIEAKAGTAPKSQVWNWISWHPNFSIHECINIQIYSNAPRHHSGEFRMSLGLSLFRTAWLLAANSSTSLKTIILGAGTCHNQCPLQPAMHVCMFVNNLFQASKSSKKKKAPNIQNWNTFWLLCLMSSHMLLNL